MTDQPTKLSRRGALAAAGTCFAMLSQRALATETVVTGPRPLKPTYTKDSEIDGLKEVKGIHQGKGAGKIKWFRFANEPWPAHFMIYDLEPGASEGVHTHFLDDRNKEGAFDEYYYIMSGSGQMEIDGKVVPVKAGDHIHTPLEVAHGVENTHPTERLRVFLTFIARAGKPYPLPGEKPKMG
jgi:oxalate decarboxylase/phosphoglucose isomerase-like protein (cupin superfamily)